MRAMADETANQPLIALAPFFVLPQFLVVSGIYLHRDHAVYLGADWIENDTAFQKLVPMKNYMDATQLQRYENHLLLSSVFESTD